MKKSSRVVWLMAALVFGSAPSFAQPENAASRQLAKKLEKLYPATTFQTVVPAEVKGLYEVTFGRSIAYTDRTGRYFIFGHLFDMRERRDLSSEKLTQIQKVPFPTQLLGHAIKTVNGGGRRVFAVFSDPDCPYCKSLEVELERLKDVTVYTFLYPLESLHPTAKAKAVSVWCAADPSKAWKDLMLHDRAPKLKNCKNPINDNLVLGSSLGVAGTPTLISQDGRVLAGWASAETIDEWLDQNEKVGL